MPGSAKQQSSNASFFQTFFLYYLLFSSFFISRVAGQSESRLVSLTPERRARLESIEALNLEMESGQDPWKVPGQVDESYFVQFGSEWVNVRWLFPKLVYQQAFLRQFSEMMVGFNDYVATQLPQVSTLSYFQKACLTSGTMTWKEAIKPENQIVSTLLYYLNTQLNPKLKFRELVKELSTVDVQLSDHLYPEALVGLPLSESILALNKMKLFPHRVLASLGITGATEVQAHFMAVGFLKTKLPRFLAVSKLYNNETFAQEWFGDKPVGVDVLPFYADQVEKLANRHPSLSLAIALGFSKKFVKKFFESGVPPDIFEYTLHGFLKEVGGADDFFNGRIQHLEKLAAFFEEELELQRIPSDALLTFASLKRGYERFWGKELPIVPKVSAPNMRLVNDVVSKRFTPEELETNLRDSMARYVNLMLYMPRRLEVDGYLRSNPQESFLNPLQVLLRIEGASLKAVQNPAKQKRLELWMLCRRALKMDVSVKDFLSKLKEKNLDDSHLLAMQSLILQNPTAGLDMHLERLFQLESVWKREAVVWVPFERARTLEEKFVIDRSLLSMAYMGAVLRFAEPVVQDWMGAAYKKDAVHVRAFVDGLSRPERLALALGFSKAFALKMSDRLWEVTLAVAQHCHLSELMKSEISACVKNFEASIMKDHLSIDGAIEKLKVPAPAAAPKKSPETLSNERLSGQQRKALSGEQEKKTDVPHAVSSSWMPSLEQMSVLLGRVDRYASLMFFLNIALISYHLENQGATKKGVTLSGHLLLALGELAAIVNPLLNEHDLTTFLNVARIVLAAPLRLYEEDRPSQHFFAVTMLSAFMGLSDTMFPRPKSYMRTLELLPLVALMLMPKKILSAASSVVGALWGAVKKLFKLVSVLRYVPEVFRVILSMIKSLGRLALASGVSSTKFVAGFIQVLYHDLKKRIENRRVVPVGRNEPTVGKGKKKNRGNGMAEAPTNVASPANPAVGNSTAMPIGSVPNKIPEWVEALPEVLFEKSEGFSLAAVRGFFARPVVEVVLKPDSKPTVGWRDKYSEKVLTKAMMLKKLDGQAQFPFLDYEILLEEASSERIFGEVLMSFYRPDLYPVCDEHKALYRLMTDNTLYPTKADINKYSTELLIFVLSKMEQDKVISELELEGLAERPRTGTAHGQSRR